MLISQNGKQKLKILSSIISWLVFSLSPNKKLILFGAGNLGILAIEALKQFNIKPNFFYDNSLKKQNKAKREF